VTAKTPRYPGWVTTAIAAIRLIWIQIERDGVFGRAAGMGYASLITIVPALVLFYAILHGFGLLTQETEAIRFVFAALVGERTPAIEFLLPGLEQMNVSALSATGLGTLLVVAVRLFLQVEEAYCDIFQVANNRGWGTRILNFYFAVTAIPALIAVTAAQALAWGSEVGVSNGRDSLVTFAQFLGLFWALKLLPATRVRWRAALLGASVSLALLQLGGVLFDAYLQRFASNDPLQVIYGALGIIPVFLFWLYVQWVLVLVGVEVAYVAQNFQALLARDLEEHDLTTRGVRNLDFSCVVAVLQVIGRHFVSGAAVDADDIAAESGVGPRDVAQILRILHEQQVVTGHGDGWRLARPAETITLEALQSAWRHRTHVVPGNTHLADRLQTATTLDDLLSPP
jgi:membrane protein